jgi:antitoxin component YwqK of YwqJK toxin-antitoxin module
MKQLISLLLLLTPGLCLADIFILKDGIRLEGEVTGEMDGVVMVQTKYGSLTINRADIQEQQAPLAAPAAPPAIPVEVSTAQPAGVEISTAQPVAVETSTQAPGVELSTQTPEGLVAPAPKLTFQTLQVSTEASLLVYYENGVAVATETYSPDGALLASQGLMADGTYTEYYPVGGLKTVRTMLGGKANGTLKAFYPSGGTQAEAYYFAGGREGPFKYYTEEGRPLMQAEYKNDRLNGWRKDYGPDGALAGEVYYIDGLQAAPPGTQASSAPSAEMQGGADSQVTVRTVSLARGERFEFRLNGKHIGRARLDKDFNLIELEGKIPDGTLKAYSKDGRLQKEFLFSGRELTGLRVYEDGGPLKAEYAYVKDKAIKK